MDKKREEVFIKTFISKRVQNRLLFELSSDKKRDSGIDRFSHNVEDIIESRRLLKKNFNFQCSYDIIKEIMNKKNIECYIISSNKELDGKCFALQETINLCDNSLGPSIIIVSDSLILIKAEQVKGAADNFLLIK